MSANPQQFPPATAVKGTVYVPELRLVESGTRFGPVILRFFGMLRLAVWRSLEHDAFATAKASAYSSILTFFPTLLVIGAVLANSRRTAVYLREISYALGTILPTGSAAAVAYLKSSTSRPLGLLVTTSLITLWTGSGVMISWMDGFRRAYQLPKIWGIVKERVVALELVLLAGLPMTFSTVLVAFGNRIETRILFYLGNDYGPTIFFMWLAIRWLIAMLTSIAVISLIYHYAVPRAQPWHYVLPGAILATVMWFLATMGFGYYLQHYADYSVIYGSLGAGIALLVWMYMISLVVLIGAEFNAMLCPRPMLELQELPKIKREH